MQSYPYSALSEPTSREHFMAAMESLSQQAGAPRFIVVRLHGADLGEVVHVVHNGGPAADERLGAVRHWSVERMLDAMRRAGPPKVFGAGEPGLEIEGYAFGVAALARVQDGACVVYLGLHGEPDAEQVFLLMSTAQLCAQHAVVGLEGRAKRACQLTPQELACLRHYVSCQNSKEAARTLGISVRTMENHLEKARIRCGVDSSLAASVLALNEGWISWPEIRAIEAVG